MSDAPPQVGPYVPQQLLALGGQSMVWLGAGPDGPVALKIARTPEARRALMREAAILKRLRHAHVVALLDADPDGEWLALERVDGEPVDRWASSGDAGLNPPRRSVEEVVDVGVQIADALEHLHRSGVIHADLKPSNVMVTGTGLAKLIDLGVATTAGEKLEGFRGTLGYAAPELLKGQPPSPQTDVYGLGALLYTVLVGRSPFVAPDPAALTYLPLVSLPPPPSSHRPETPAPLNQLLLSMLARDAARRPSDLGKIREGLVKARGALPGPPILGMVDEREELRRAVVGAADGEPRVVVLYGVAGSGRRTLIAEAVDYARREGMPYLRGTDPAGALTAIREAASPSVLVMKAAHRGARQLAETVLKDKLGCLLLLHSDRPVPGLTGHGAIQITPTPLSTADATRLAQVWSADPGLAEDWWRKSMGLPIAILGRIRAWRRDHGQSVTQHAPLPAESRRIYDALRNRPKMKSLVLELAAELQMVEHVLLDHCEVLFAEGLVEPADDGLSVVVTRARSVV